MGPHVLCLPQKSVCIGALQRRLQRMETAIAVVMFDPKLAKVRQGALFSDGIDTVVRAAIEKAVPLAADVANHADEAMGQLLLNLEIPILVVQVAPQAIDSFWTGSFRLETAQEWRNRVREVWHIGG